MPEYIIVTPGSAYRSATIEASRSTHGDACTTAEAIAQKNMNVPVSVYEEVTTVKFGTHWKGPRTMDNWQDRPDSDGWWWRMHRANHHNCKCVCIVIGDRDEWTHNCELYRWQKAIVPEPPKVPSDAEKLEVARAALLEVAECAPTLAAPNVKACAREALEEIK